ncbi:restriction endonuclease subunit S [Chlorobaculum tepidum]|nr:restriction endonuclease subunit S [Chlorobaculum tepidum]
MGSEWLGEECEIVMGQSPPSETCNTVGIGIPLLNGPTEFGPHHPSPAQFTTDVRKRAIPGDILFCVRGSTTGRMNWADQEYAIGRGIAAIRHKFKPELQPFVRAVIECYLPELLAQATGSTFPNVSAQQLSNLKWPELAADEQRAIAYILGTLDDKIELNRKQNETLEAMARALFKAWFVDFEPVRAKLEGRWQRGQSLPGLPAHLYDLFPDCLVDSELGEIPEGWEIGSFADVVEIIGGSTPKTSVSEYWGGDIPWFSVVDTPASSDVFVVQTEKSITQSGLNESSARLISKGTTIISARGTVGNLAIAGCDMTFNQSCYALRSKNSLGSYFVFLSAQRMVEQLKAMAHGSVFSTITRQTFEAVQTVLPPENVLQQFERSFASLFDEILNNVNESRTLAKLRDTLLPKLISGELRVNDAKRILARIELDTATQRREQ